MRLYIQNLNIYIKMNIMWRNIGFKLSTKIKGKYYNNIYWNKNINILTEIDNILTNIKI
jgi:hypothetical protein